MSNTTLPLQIGKYRIQAEIGGGATAVVYRATDPDLNRLVALKVLRPELAQEPESVVRFQRGAQAAAGLHHTGIVTIYEVGKDGPHHFIAMAYLEGQTLDVLRQQGMTFSPQQVLQIAGQVAAALDYAHASGVIHRDIKPGNIIVNRDGRATLVDFGLALVLAGSRVTHDGTVMGTAYYISPEAVKGINTSKASDVYSLGIVIYELLAGRPPFVGEHVLAVMHMHAQEQPPSPRQFNPRIPESVAGVLMVALAKDPARRWSSAKQLVAALEAAYAGKPPIAPPVIAGVPTPPGGAKSTPTPPRAPGERRQPSAGVILASVLGLAAIVLVSVVALFAIRARGPVIIGPEPTVDATMPTNASVTSEPPGVEIRQFMAIPDTSLQAGQCTNLTWDADNAVQVYLDGKGVALTDSQEVCPDVTTTYTLKAVGVQQSDEQTLELTVEVSPAPTDVPLSPTAIPSPTIPPPTPIPLPTVPTIPPPTQPPPTEAFWVEYFERPGGWVIPKGDLCANVRWKVHGATLVQLQEGDGRLDDVPAEGERTNICFPEKEKVFRLHCTLLSGEVKVCGEVKLVRQDDDD